MSENKSDAKVASTAVDASTPTDVAAMEDRLRRLQEKIDRMESRETAPADDSEKTVAHIMREGFLYRHKMEKKNNSGRFGWLIDVDWQKEPIKMFCDTDKRTEAINVYNSRYGQFDARSMVIKRMESDELKEFKKNADELHKARMAP